MKIETAKARTLKEKNAFDDLCLNKELGKENRESKKEQGKCKIYKKNGTEIKYVAASQSGVRRESIFCVLLFIYISIALSKPSRERKTFTSDIIDMILKK